MHTTLFSTLGSPDQALLKEAAQRTTHSLNKVSNPQTSAIVCTANGKYYGNNIFLSNCTLSCAEANALASAVAAGDTKMAKLYFAVGRTDDKEVKIITPCGNCRQMLHDFSLLHNKTITIYLTTTELKEVLVTDSESLLPAGFKSVSLGKMDR